MPSRNLKSALLSQQAEVNRQKARVRKLHQQQLKAASIESSLSNSKHPNRKSKPKQSKRVDKDVDFKSIPIRSTIPFDRQDTILLLGEANFSYALSIIQPPFSHPPHQLCATTYDSEAICHSKYPDARENIEELRREGVVLGFEVDAGNLQGSKVVRHGPRWSRIIFNFPHVGVSFFHTFTSSHASVTVESLEKPLFISALSTCAEGMILMDGLTYK